MRLILTNAHLIDCINPTPIPGASVTMEDGRIVEVLDGHRSPAIQGDEVIDVRGSYLLPGLWDVHVHLEWPRLSNPTLAEQAVQYGFNARQGLLEAGVVGIRTAGVPHFIDVGMKRAFDAWQPVGPRVFAGGYFLTTTAGHALASEFAKACDGPNGFVKAIREQIQHGVDHIKLNLTGGIMGPSWDRHWHSFLLPEELEAAFTICQQRGYPVMAHAANPEAVKTALRLGAHTVEHGYIMDEECLQLFLKHVPPFFFLSPPGYPVSPSPVRRPRWSPTWRLPDAGPLFARSGSRPAWRICRACSVGRRAAGVAGLRRAPRCFQYLLAAPFGAVAVRVGCAPCCHLLAVCWSSSRFLGLSGWRRPR